MKVYIYCADIYCEDCGERIRQELIASGKAPDDIDDECSYDSDEFPKGPYSDGGGESDCPQHCACQAECINAIELSDGWKVGAWLKNPLTTDGARYVAEYLRADPDNEVNQLWAEWYAEELSYLD
jgi:hypothetical protein